MVARHSRPEAFSKILTTLDDEVDKKASIIDDANYQDTKGDLKLRGIEAGKGIKINVVDADEYKYEGMDLDKKKESKIVISVSGGLMDDLHDTELLVHNAPISTIGDTVFPIPVYASSTTFNPLNSSDTAKLEQGYKLRVTVETDGITSWKLWMIMVLHREQTI